jgi:hypothetical protein
MRKEVTLCLQSGPGHTEQEFAPETGLRHVEAQMIDELRGAPLEFCLNNADGDLGHAALRDRSRVRDH